MADQEAKSNIAPDKTDENVPAQEKEIDILGVLYKLWGSRKLLLVWAIWGVIAGLIIAFSIPREYTTSVKLAPESQNSRTTISGGLGALASMAGISSASSGGSDAFYPSLYPEIVESVPFITSLFDVPVKDKEGNTYTVRLYLEEETRGPWWSVITEFPRHMINLMRSRPDEEKGHVIDNFQLTPEEDHLVNELRHRVWANVDQKTNVITISTQMQDPMVSAILVDTVVARLREYITQYRTNKARQDLEYSQKLNEEARQEYYKAQQRLADFIDRNQNLATRSAQVTQERLENEASLSFNVYNETAIQVQSAKSRVQETTPVYTEITPATVPFRPTSPRKGLIIGGCAFLAVVACAFWIIFGPSLKNYYHSKSSSSAPFKQDSSAP